MIPGVSTKLIMIIIMVVLTIIIAIFFPSLVKILVYVIFAMIAYTIVTQVLRMNKKTVKEDRITEFKKKREIGAIMKSGKDLIQESEEKERMKWKRK